MKLVSLENITKYNELLNQKMVKSVNSVKPDANGNVPLGTEKSTFNKVTFDTDYFSVATDSTYSFDLTGTDLELIDKEKIQVRIVAKVTTANSNFEEGDIAELALGVDHSANDDLDVCAYIRGNLLYVYSGSSQYLSIRNSTGWLRKDYAQIKVILTAFVPDDGTIQLIATDSTGTTELVGTPSGTLTWNSQNIVRSVNGVNADASGNVTISSLIPNQIIQSPVPLTDANLHLLDGALLSGDGAYSAYVDLIAELYNGGTASTSFCTEAEWQTSNTAFGFCNKFVYDSVANTVRLPKINSLHGALIKSYQSGEQWYKIYQDGWCIQGGRTETFSAGEITIALSRAYIDTNYSAFVQIQGTTGASDNTDPVAVYSKTTTNFKSNNPDGGWSRSHMWITQGYVDISDLQTSPIYEYIVIGTISKTDILIDIDNVLTDLNGKADKDLSNVALTSAFATAMNSANIRTVIETYSNNYSWYRVWSDGFCEQGGCILENGVTQVRQVTFAKPFGNTYYTVSGIHCRTQGAISTPDVGTIGTSTITATGFKIFQYNDQRTYWTACGYIS